MSGNGIGLDLTGRIVGRTADGRVLVALTMDEYLETLPVIGQRSQEAVDVDFGRRALAALGVGWPAAAEAKKYEARIMTRAAVKDASAAKPVRKAGLPRKTAQEPVRRGRGKPKQLPAKRACEHCGVAFAPVRATSRFCSIVCRAKAVNAMRGKKAATEPAKPAAPVLTPEAKAARLDLIREKMKGVRARNPMAEADRPAELDQAQREARAE